MLGTIAITDHDWYRQLFQHGELDEVNFWKPSARRAFLAEEYSPFLFKLHAPDRAICGFGYFWRYYRLQDWLAWDCFGVANGSADLGQMRGRVQEIRDRIRYRDTGSQIMIGCVIILGPVFFPPDMWVEQPRDWPIRTQTSKTYDLKQGEGRRVWEQCLERARQLRAEKDIASAGTIAEPAPRYGQEHVIRPRLGQGTFRLAVTDAYSRGCAFTDEHSLPALDAAHIKPYKEDGPHLVTNGLLLRADIHRLFEKGYLTVTAGRRIEVSRRLREEYKNGRSYYPLHGKEVRAPGQAANYPGKEFITWHNENVFRA